MKKIPFCGECMHYGGKGLCKHPEYGGKYEHINRDFWCVKGKFKNSTMADVGKLEEKHHGKEAAV